ncbi:MAG: LUD domain-containing protein [Bacteroidetes bacterium]|nr:LUD domain-containing protein [Bacteroidota bacterium]
MSSKEKILAAVRASQPALQPLPDVNDIAAVQFENNVAQFTAVLNSIGGLVVNATHTDAIKEYVKNNFAEGINGITTVAKLNDFPLLSTETEAHLLANIDVAILPAKMGVAENGAVWLTEAEYGIRALPFICQHLIVMLQQHTIVQNMHEAYKKINKEQYGFGVFIAGPSKTADIEQSLVLGAHGPESMTVFILP